MELRRETDYILFGYGIDRYSWRGVWWFFLFYFGAFFFAAMLAPIIYLWIQGMETPQDPEALVSYLQSKPVSRYVDRVRLLFVAVGLIWLIAACGLWGRFGFHWSEGSRRQLPGFFLAGVLSLGMVVAAQAVFLDPRFEEGTNVTEGLEIVLGALVAGLLVGWLEEAIFRGMVFRMFYTAVKPLPAVILSALAFAAVHFKDVPSGMGVDFHWYSGFLVAGYQSISVFLTVEWLDFANLFLAGVVLNLVFLRTGSLVPCMGLHAGWVLVRNSWNDLVNIREGGATQFWGSASIVDGYASLIMLTGIAIGLYVETKRHQKSRQVGLGEVA
ncbi:MAG: CPBP family intramembrane glutamic endopeptidase [Oceanipulchritudo sp.]